MSSSLQRDTALLFADLGLRKEFGPGTLSLCVGLQHTAVPLAVIGLGGACLVVGVQPAEGRNASRQGVVDFVVDHLGEALRILKNELRQRRPVSVAVTGDTETTVAEMLRCGVQPQTVFANGAVQAQGFLERGAVLLDADIATLPVTLIEDVAESSAGRRERDLRLIASLVGADHAAGRIEAHQIAAQWLRVAPRLFPKDRERWYWQADEGNATG